jgi:hypothetical protein
MDKGQTEGFTVLLIKRIWKSWFDSNTAHNVLGTY